MGFAAAIALWVALVVGYPRGGQEMVVLLPDAEGKVGTIVVETEKGEQVVLNSAYATARSDRAGTVKRETAKEEEVRQTFQSALAAQPRKPASFTIYFDTGSDELPDAMKPEIERVLAEMKSRESPEITVIGHTDLVGANEDNDDLSVKRAERVRDVLIRSGVPADRITVAGRGKREPAVRTSQGIDEPRNRRVVIDVR
ncbi:MAG TPA: OmpA family protein [Burkholderiales bacterium]|nr:OmpA family protein [Burkholderiales bacterium]